MKSAPRLGAALAFSRYSRLRGLIILIALTGLFLGPRRQLGQIVEQIQFLDRPPGADAIEATILSARDAEPAWTAVALITLVSDCGTCSASCRMRSLQTRFWGVTSIKPGRGLLVVLRERFWVFPSVVGIGFSVAWSRGTVSAWARGTRRRTSRLHLRRRQFSWKAVNPRDSFCVITFLFGMYLQASSRRERDVRDVYGQARADLAPLHIRKGRDRPL
jgi:uncharacterized BrkB/YihY/UPF0761 family membrane protein